LLFNNNIAKFHIDTPRIKSVFGTYQVRAGLFKDNLHNITKMEFIFKIKFINLKYDVISFQILISLIRK